MLMFREIILGEEDRVAMSTLCKTAPCPPTARPLLGQECVDSHMTTRWSHAVTLQTSLKREDRFPQLDTEMTQTAS